MSTYNFAGVMVDFSGFQEDCLFGTWQWKLDAYRTDAMPQVRISQAPVSVDTSGILLQQEYSGFFHKSVFLQKDGSSIWKMTRSRSGEEVLSFRVNSEWNQIDLLEDHTNSAGSAAFEYLSSLIPGVLLKQADILTLHSALVEYHDRGFAICADSGVGKTTHARIWRDAYRALIVNGDRSAVRIEENEAAAYGLPWSGTSGEQICRKVPLKAIVILERARSNEVQRINGMEAFQALLPHLQVPAWEKEMVEKSMDKITMLLENVPVFRLRCLPNVEAAQRLKLELEQL